MPKKVRFKTTYPGVYFIEGTAIGSGKSEKIYYIVYRRQGKLIEEKAGRQFQDDMTPARAAQIRTQRIQGAQPSNKAKRDAMRAQKEAEANIWTINKLWSEYLNNNPDLKGKATDKNRFDNHIKPIFGNKEPKDIFPLEIDRLQIKLLKEKQPGTVKNVLELMRRIINFGVKKNLCPGLAFTIEMPKVNNLKTEDLTDEQIAKLIAAIETATNAQAANFMKMVLFTGMRRGELFRLKWDDVDFERGFIHIREPKGGKDQTIPLNGDARKVLLNHARSKSPYIFPGRNGKQLTDIRRPVNRIKNEAGLPKEFRALHGLRHLFATMLASSGKVDMYTLQKLLTHKSPLMTQRYAHLRDKALRNASNVAGVIIKKALKSVTADEESDNSSDIKNA
jgi:integrase